MPSAARGRAGEPDLDVAEQLDRHAARAAGHERPEGRIADGSDDQLGARRGHALDVEASTDAPAAHLGRGTGRRSTSRGASQPPPSPSPAATIVAAVAVSAAGSQGGSGGAARWRACPTA
jgi:hypothetical protein